MTGRAFLFGKLPAHGDFVARGLSPQEQSAWDDWASAGLERARSSLGDGFEEAHDAAPPWRFITMHGGGWRLGSLACSVDGAGRRFVLVLGLADLNTAEAMALGVRGAEAVEAILYDALVSRTAADAAVETLRTGVFVDPTDVEALDLLSPSPAADGVWWTLGGERHPPRVIPAAEPPPDLLLTVLECASQLEMAT
ncbi:MAG TPA: type VI secretion system-associated protein TagF [Caulobacteraceae bacterium]|jgi:type VI secretion system protein ImpM